MSVSGDEGISEKVTLATKNFQGGALLPSHIYAIFSGTMGRANLKEVPMERDCQSLATRVQAKKKFQGGQMEGGGAQPPLKSTYLRKPSYIVIENNLLGKARLRLVDFWGVDLLRSCFLTG